MSYTIRRLRLLEDFTPEIEAFIIRMGFEVERRYRGRFDSSKFNPYAYARRHLFLVCFRNDKPVAALLAQLFKSVFDDETKILMQDLLVATPGSGRAAHALMSELIDFGKLNANHVFTTITDQANIKSRSLARMGFRKIEETYALEFVNGVGRKV